MAKTEKPATSKVPTKPAAKNTAGKVAAPAKPAGKKK
ncbi:hypothetical protein M5M_14072 [Simiduia agarivorans SA1 = DSM 21679]|uniref:Uncharacterized protein n=1 Tax=Simiduia agarivorans (strain DSM 21679 / JCM 13881 / BCRC 17597 / SA1) TaxID=1117647 RepID=R9S694_SIMAS|nr:hypothetical protein M5M_14072 [Simiduia agarivorans SA1 = DSM 21679]